MDYLKQCLDSVINQTYRNLEIIIVLQESDETKKDKETIELIRSYQDPRILLVIEDKTGIAHARNVGISKSKGKFLALMDSDDICELDRIQHQVEFFENHEVDIVGTTVKAIDENNNILGIVKVPLNPEEIRKSVMVSSPFVGPTPMFSRKIIEKGELYNESFPLASDYEFYIRLIAGGAICHNIDEPLVLVRENNQSITRKSCLKWNFFCLFAKVNGISLGLRKPLDFVYFFLTLPTLFFTRRMILLSKQTMGKLFSREMSVK